MEYGDSLTVEEQEEILQAEMRGVAVQKMVAALCAGDDRSRYEDVLQESRVAMWGRASMWDGRGTFQGYLHQVARWKAKDILTGHDSYTGTVERRRAVSQRRGDESRSRLRTAIRELQVELGRAPTSTELAERMGVHPQYVNKLRRTYIGDPAEVRVRSLESLMEDLEQDGLSILEAEGVLEEIALAYHYGEIYSAVSELRHAWRAYVFLRFWQGYTDSEAAAFVEAKRWHTWTTIIRPFLADRLRHLEMAT